MKLIISSFRLSNLTFFMNIFCMNHWLDMDQSYYIGSGSVNIYSYLDRNIDNYPVPIFPRLGEGRG